MAIVLKNGAVFLHIPKTGGNWVTRILDELDMIERKVGHKHADLDHFLCAPLENRKALFKYLFRGASKEAAGKPFMFCFVRNPLDWYESWFKYMSQPSRQWRHWGDEKSVIDWHPNAMLNGLGSEQFPAFVRNVNARRPGYVTELFGWYTGAMVDYIGKQENLVEDFIEVMRLMQLNVDEDWVRGYGKVGASPKLKKEIAWPVDLKKETALYEYAGLMRYGYRDSLVELGVDTRQLIA